MNKKIKVGHFKFLSSISADAKYLDLVSAKTSIDASYAVVTEEERLQNKTTEFVGVYSKKEAH
jgi:hypothetical protein